MTGYRTLAAKGEAELVIQRSRFIGRGFPVESEAAALAILADIRKAHWDASHNCFAYRIGPDGGCARYSDDGEPGGTAGLPMMEVLKSRGLTDLLVVVTRYFGGILLGAGGLVRAYSKSAAAAIQAAGEVEVLSALRYHITIPYNRYGGLEPLLRERALVEAVDFGQDVQVTALVEAAQAPGFCKAVTEKSDGRCTPALLGEGWLRRPCPPRD